MDCHICSQKTKYFTDETTSIVYYYCLGCEYIFKSLENYSSIEKQKARYDLHDNDEGSESYKAYYQRFLDFVLPLVGSPESALDFGCGKSTLLVNMLNNMNIKSTYYDPLYHPNTTYDSKKYELIVSTEVFEHLHRPDEVFVRLLSRLEQHGYLAIQTQFHPNNSDIFKRWYYHQDPTHIVFFRSQTFKVLCKIHGCKYIGDNEKNIVVIRKNKNYK